MAKPIKITPVLRGMDVVNFNKTIKANVAAVKSNPQKFVDRLKSIKESYQMFEKTLVK